ncbi:MAG: tetratricopeptide repeat protein [Thermodesulfobacteriota bacterium]
MLRYSTNRWRPAGRLYIRNIMLGIAVTLFSLVANYGCTSLPKSHEVEALRPPPKAHLRPLLAYDLSDKAVAEERAGLSVMAESFVVDNGEIRDVIKTLFRDSGLNYVIDEEVKGTVSLHYNNMTAEEMLDAMLSTNGYLYTINKNHIRIGQVGTKVFTFNLPAEEEGDSVWDDIESELDKIKSETGRIVLNPGAGTIMVTDTYENLTRMESYIDMIEEALLRQVLIETKIIEVTLSDTFKFGVDYSIFPDSLGISATGILEGGAAVLQGMSPKGGTMQFGVTEANNYSTLVNILQTQGQVNVLSSPRIVALNNMTATINIAEQIPVIERSVIDSGGGIRTEFEIRFEDAGIALDVTPKIGVSGEMIIKVNPKITEQTGTISTPDGLQTEPILNVRESTNTVKIRDGESIIIGGFIQNRKTEELGKVPYLGEIPLFGGLFQNIDQKLNKVELIVVLTPRLLNSSLNNRFYKRSVGRITKLMRPYERGILKKEEQSDITRGFLDERERPSFGKSAIGSGGNSRGITRSGMAYHYLRKGEEALESGRYEEAAKALESALFFSPLDGEAYFKLALLYELMGNDSKSVEMAGKYLADGRVEPSSINTLAMTYSNEGDTVLAIKLLKIAVRDHPGSPVLKNNLGVLLMGKGDYGEARRMFEASLANDDDRPFKEGLYNLAITLEQAGEIKEAIDCYRRFLRIGSSEGRHSTVEVERHIERLSRIADEAPGGEAQSEK